MQDSPYSFFGGKQLSDDKETRRCGSVYLGIDVLGMCEDFLLCVLGRAQNNLRRVSGHDDRPNSYKLGQISFLAGQIYKMNNS